MRARAQLPTLRAMLKTALSAIVVVAAFAGALYAGGNVMGAWEPYEAAEPAAGGHKTAAAPKRSRRKHARPVRQVRDARWMRRANALCVAALREGAATRAPRTAAELAAFLKRGVEQNRRWNRRLLALGSPRGGARKFARIRGLFREDESLVADLLTAVRQQDGASAMLLGDRLMSLARRESALLVGLGARECALPTNAI
jgi:hypothetical protein